MEKIQLILYGNANTGKTSTLMKLVEILCGSTPAIIADIAGFMWPSGGYKDARFVIEYRDHHVCICTAGDSWVVSSVNCDLFDLMHPGNITVYEASPLGVTKLSARAKSLLNEPEICVCACRPNGDRYGAIKAIHSYSHKHIVDYSFQFWFRKKEEKDKTKFAAASLAMAEKLKEYIDDYIDGKL